MTILLRRKKEVKMPQDERERPRTGLAALAACSQSEVCPSMPPAESGVETASVAAKQRRMTPKQAVLAYCKECLLFEVQRARFDCLNQECPLYVAMPWRGKELVKRLDVVPGNPWVDRYVADLQAEAVVVPLRRPTAALLRARCRECQPQTVQDCGCPECPLYPWHPYQPGGPKKQARSVKQHEASKAAAIRLAAARSMR